MEQFIKHELPLYVSEEELITASNADMERILEELSFTLGSSYFGANDQDPTYQEVIDFDDTLNGAIADVHERLANKYRNSRP